MEELLTVVADAVRRVGGNVLTHRGTIGDVLADDMVFVVVPHEYFVLTGEHPADVLRKTIGFGVEHPGTQTFETASRFARPLAAHFEIGQDAVIETTRRGINVERFVLGYSPLWDRRDSCIERDIDVIYLGTADPRRLAHLATIAPHLSRFRTEFLIPPHEPMVGPRPDFLTGDAKWRLLARSRLLLNMHRETTTALEWVRVLEAMANGCVVLTEPSSDLAPLVPGEHILVADSKRMGQVAACALERPAYLETIAAAAHDLSRRELDMLASARRFLAVAASVSTTPPPRPALITPTRRSDETALAVWIPQERQRAISPARSKREREELASNEQAQAPNITHGTVRAAASADVVCVRGRDDGPLGLTFATIGNANLHIALNGNAFHVTQGTAPAAVAKFSQPVSIGLARNTALSLGSSQYVVVLNAGDELFTGTLEELVEVLDKDPAISVAYTMATLGSAMIVNALVPEQRRLDSFAYLSRGYIVRRAWIEHLSGFTEDASADDLVDHDFWVRTMRRGGAVKLLRKVGLRLWPNSGV